MNEPVKVSVIIPCYNQGQYIDEAVDSVLAQTFQDFEIIIVNDGSTDEFTNDKLKNYNKPKTRVIHTNNQGLSAARNNGISESKGEYILPLDADDKIGASYIEKAIEVLDENTNIKIVYSNVRFFGEINSTWILQEYSFEKILSGNIIYCSAIYRRSDYNETAGYNSNMKFGYEDWDFWLSLLENGGDVYKIPEILFFYRRKKGSMIDDLLVDKQKRIVMNRQVYENHLQLYLKNFPDPISLFLEKEQIFQEKEQLQKKIKIKTSDILYKKIRNLAAYVSEILHFEKY